MAALPTLPLGAASDDKARSEYLDALQKVSAAIDAQSEQKFPWFEMAGAFLNPGQTGSFGEGLGRAGAVLGQHQRQQQANTIPLAQMKMALAGQRYEVENKAKALQLLGSALGTTPDKAAEALQAGTLPANAITPQLYATIAQLSPAVGEMVKQIFAMQKDTAELGLKQRSAVLEDVKAGMSQAELISKYGQGVLSLIPGGGLPRSSQGQPAAAAPSVTAPVAQAQPVQPQPQLPSTDLSQAPTQPSDLEGLPLAAQAEVMKKRTEEMDKPFIEKRNTVVSYDPAMLSSSTRDLRELYQITEKYPRIFGLLMENRGILGGLQAAAQQGVSMGQLGNVSLPVEEFVKKYRLSRDEEVNLQIAGKIIARQFFENARVNKATLGPQISNSDVVLLKAPAVTEQDSAEAIRYWVKQNILGNKQREDMYRQLSTYEKQAGGRASPSQFFRSPAFDNILKTYDSLFNELMIKHSPAYTPAPGGR